MRSSRCRIVHSLTLDGRVLVSITLVVRYLCQGMVSFPPLLLYLPQNAFFSSFSRVGIVGPNGAGKSTLIKLLTVRECERAKRYRSNHTFITGRDSPPTRHGLQAPSTTGGLRIAARNASRRSVLLTSIGRMN